MEERRLDPPWHKLEEQCTGSKVDERNGTGTRGYAKDANNISSARCTRCPKERTVKFALQNSTIFHSLPLFQLPPFFSFFFFLTFLSPSFFSRIFSNYPAHYFHVPIILDEFSRRFPPFLSSGKRKMWEDGRVKERRQRVVVEGKESGRSGKVEEA